MLEIERNIEYGQFRCCLAVLQIGTTAIVLKTPKWLERLIPDYQQDWYGARFEIFTPCRRFRFSPGGRPNLRRRRAVA
jgi:hypothetical protein